MYSGEEEKLIVNILNQVRQDLFCTPRVSTKQTPCNAREVAANG